MKITIKDIKKYYATRLVLDIENLEFEKGKITGILGPNGSGKSTLMTIIAGLNSKNKGSVKYDNLEFDEVKNDITYMSHNSYLFNDNVFNNISYPLRFRKRDPEEVNGIVNSLIEEFDLKHLADKSALNLSGGERQKVCLARALSFNPKLLIIDEPTSNIDPNFVRLIERSLKSQKVENNTTVLIVTHNTSQAFRICDNIVFIKDGKVVFEGSQEEIKASENKIINDFIELN